MRSITNEALARKYRPQVLGQIIGQDAITRTLRNSVVDGRVHHAYIFTGTRGVGKTTAARILAKMLNCEARDKAGDPCNKCKFCVEIAGGFSMEVMEIDAASHTGVDNVREMILENLSVMVRSAYKVFIIDEVHMLSPAAFNALLKAIEEPPQRVVFIMCTTEPRKIPETVQSRCQIFDFKQVSQTLIAKYLQWVAMQESVRISEVSVQRIARYGAGSVRDALSAFEQVVSYAASVSVANYGIAVIVEDGDVGQALGLIDAQLVTMTVQAVAKKDARKLLQITQQVVERGYSYRDFIKELMAVFAATLRFKITVENWEGMDTETQRAVEHAANFSEQDILRMFTLLTRLERDVTHGAHPELQLEIGLVKLAFASDLTPIEELMRKVEDLTRLVRGAKIA